MATSRRLVIMAAVIFGVLLGGAPAAFAHATLEHSSPGSGSVLKQPPTKVILTFAESVGVAHGDIEVYDDHLHRVDLNDAGHPTGSGDTVGVRLAPDLHRGTYSVTWRVISADSHPISGGYTFSVGAPSMVTGKPPVLSGGHRSVGILLGAMRLLGYFGLIAGAGGLAFLLIWREGRTEPLLRRITGGGFAAGVVSAAGLFIIQAPYAQGSSLAHLFDGDLLNLVAHSHYGRAVAIRLALWLTAATAVTLWLHGVRRAAWLVVPLVVALPVTWAVAGHGDTGSDVWLSLASESLHVLAVAVWMGGLVVLSAHLLRREDRELIFAVLPRFSTVGLMSVATIVVTGLYQA